MNFRYFFNLVANISKRIVPNPEERYFLLTANLPIFIAGQTEYGKSYSSSISFNSILSDSYEKNPIISSSYLTR